MKNIGLAEFGIVNWMIFVTCGVAVITGVLALKWLIISFSEHFKDVKDAVYREEHGLFDIIRYANGSVPACVPRRQKNKGPEPETFSRVIPSINYFEMVDFDNNNLDTEEKRGAL